MPQAEDTGGGKDGCNASTKVWEVLGNQLTDLTVRGRVIFEE
jgi:hypothetical protein